LPSDISEDTAKELIRISQQNGSNIGNLGELCDEFLEATAVKNSKSKILDGDSRLWGVECHSYPKTIFTQP